MEPFDLETLGLVYWKMKGVADSVASKFPLGPDGRCRYCFTFVPVMLTDDHERCLDSMLGRHNHVDGCPWVESVDVLEIIKKHKISLNGDTGHDG